MNWIKEYKDDLVELATVLDKFNKPMLWLLAFLLGVMFGIMSAIQTMTWLDVWDIYCMTW